MYRSVIYSIALAFFVLDYGTRSAYDHVSETPGVPDYGPLALYPPVEYRLWRALRLTHLQDLASVPWRDALESVRGALAAKGLVTAKHLLTEDTPDSTLEAYDAELATTGAPVFQAERQWAIEGLDITNRPPPAPSRIWVWRFNYDGE
jgi:hypothetical protein